MLKSAVTASVLNYHRKLRPRLLPFRIRYKQCAQHWHFLWCKGWQKVDIYGPPTYLVDVVCEQSLGQKEGNILWELVLKSMEFLISLPICVYKSPHFWNSECFKEVDLQCGFSFLENTLIVPIPVTEFWDFSNTKVKLVFVCVCIRLFFTDFLVLSSWKVNVAENPIDVMGL